MKAILVPLVFLLSLTTHAQQKTIIRTKTELLASLKNNPNKTLINLSTYIPGITLDIRYATTNNFTHQILYTNPIPYLRKPAADALKKVQAALNKRGLRLIIYDAYRPLSVTQKIWDHVHDSRYAANPTNGSGHNRGLSVDVSIISIMGKENTGLNMGTDFDNFTDTAAHTFKKLDQQVLINRKRLKATMEKHGFKSLNTEWWHYSWPNNGGYELIDISFEEINN
ncbi:M15 family metallopeptidase [Flavipsychrobacter stenotrophus]|nr:M15 family metallopeptidase [Flavipsychrobacter stenotrophus]